MQRISDQNSSSPTGLPPSLKSRSWSRTLPPRTLTADQVKAIWIGLEGDWFQVAFVLAVTLGLRRGEVSALRWRDIDLDHRVVVVSRWMRHLPHGDIELRSNSLASRRVAIPNRTIETLRQHQSWWARRLDSPTLLAAADDRVLIRPDGVPPSLQTFSNYWNYRRTGEGLKGTGASEIQFHDLRRSFAMLLLGAGADQFQVRRQLGLYKLNVTADMAVDPTSRGFRPSDDLWEDLLGSDSGQIRTAASHD
jgi:integrase